MNRSTQTIKALMLPALFAFALYGAGSTTSRRRSTSSRRPAPAAAGAAAREPQGRPRSPRRRGQGAVQDAGDPRRHADRRHRRARRRVRWTSSSRATGSPAVRSAGTPGLADAPEPRAAGGPRDRRHRDVPDARLRRHARPRRRRAEERGGRVRLQALARARRDDGARRVARAERDGRSARRSAARRTRSSRRASTTISVRAAAGTRAASIRPRRRAAYVEWAAKNGIDGLKLGADRPEIMAALLDGGEEARPRLDRAPAAERRRADERDQGGAPRPRHGHALLRPLRVAAEGLRRPAVAGGHERATTSSGGSARWRACGTRSIEPGSPEWKAYLEEHLKLGTVFDPTLTIYSAGRDVMRASATPSGTTSTRCRR